MGRIRLYGAKAESVRHREYSFTVEFQPVNEIKDATAAREGSSSRLKNIPKESGYQVTVASLPGLITYGRTMKEAREMARDAIRCHLEGLQKAGEAIPDERTARREKVRVALSA